MKAIIVGLVLFIFPGALFALEGVENICPNEAVRYCEDIGRDAYNNEDNPPYLQGKRIGRIIGVSRTAQKKLQDSSKMGGVDDAPSIGEVYDYFYIVDDGTGNRLQRACEEIDAR